MSSRRTSLSLVSVALALLGGCSKTDATLRPGRYAGANLVLLSVDTLRADHLGLYGHTRDTSPGLDRRSAEMIVFDRAHVPRGLTWPSLASLLTGLYPITSNVRHNGDLLAAEIPTLTSLLRARGYTTAAFLANACAGFQRDLDESSCGTDPEVQQAALAWLAAAPPEPFFAWIHYMAPHVPYDPPPEHDVFRDAAYQGPAKGSQSYLDQRISRGERLAPADHEHVVALYDGEVRYADAMIGEVFDALSRSGRLERSIVVVTSDHGEELGQHHGYYYHACSIYEAVLHVPLLIRLPDGYAAGQRFQEVVETIDLAPTLLELLGFEPDPGMEGESLVPLIAREPGAAERFTHSFSEYYLPRVGEITSIGTRRWRYIHNPEQRVPRCMPPGSFFRPGLSELYDHAADPLERDDVAAANPHAVVELAAELRRMRQAQRERAAPQRADPEVIRRLEALGYVGDAPDTR